MLVGEQPGDIEDRRGHPFVGPAGRMLDRILDEAGIARDEVFLTNAVKHFRWSGCAGQAPADQRPATTHITACRPWLAAELRAVRPSVVVALGAVAGEALYGPSFSVTRARGVELPWPPDSGAFAGSRLRLDAGFATLHPSAVLRGDDDRRHRVAPGHRGRPGRGPGVPGPESGCEAPPLTVLMFLLGPLRWAGCLTGAASSTGRAADS